MLEKNLQGAQVIDVIKATTCYKEHTHGIQMLITTYLTNPYIKSLLEYGSHP